MVAGRCKWDLLFIFRKKQSECLSISNQSSPFHKVCSDHSVGALWTFLASVTESFSNACQHYRGRSKHPWCACLAALSVTREIRVRAWDGGSRSPSAVELSGAYRSCFVLLGAQRSQAEGVGEVILPLLTFASQQQYIHPICPHQPGWAGLWHRQSSHAARWHQLFQCLQCFF